MIDTSQSFMDKLNQRPASSIKKKIILIVSLFLIISLILLGLSILQSQIMNSVRSYVRGEGLWAKSQKDAVFHIFTYTRSHDLRDYHLFQDSLKVPLGDKQARMTLQSDQPDLERAYAGFLTGGNHPQDIEGMIWFFRYFQNFPYMNDAIDIWTRADGMILKLIESGEDLLNAVRSGDEEKSSDALHHLEKINWKLAKLETNFSLVLSEGARWVRSTLMWTGLLFLGLIMTLVLRITLRIIREIDQTEQQLRVSENRFTSLYESDILGIIDWDKEGQILEANQTFLKMLGFSKSDINSSPLNWRKLTPEAYAESDRHALEEINRFGYCTPFEKQFLNKNGKPVPVLIGAALLGGEEGKVVCFVNDLSKQKQAESELRLAATVFDASSDGIIVTDDKMSVLTVNSTYCRMTGSLQAVLKGQLPYLLRPGVIPPEQHEEIMQALKRGGRWSGDMLEQTAEGNRLPVHLSLNEVLDSVGKISHYVIIVSDISERKAVEEQLRQMAHYDSLTGLANRKFYDDRLELALKRATRNKTLVALLFCDLDRFKPVNDQYGHITGDKLLKLISERLLTTVRANDTVARIGGDEFAILLEDLHEAAMATDIATKIIETIEKPCVINGNHIQIACSIGIAIYPDHAGNEAGLLRLADQAMYEAKSSQDHQFCLYTRQ